MERAQARLPTFTQRTAMADKLREEDNQCVLCLFSDRTIAVEDAVRVRLSCRCNLFAHESCLYTHIGYTLEQSGVDRMVDKMLPSEGAAKNTKFGKFVRLLAHETETYQTLLHEPAPTVDDMGITCPNCYMPLITEAHKLITKKIASYPDGFQKTLDKGVKAAIACHDIIAAIFWTNEGGKVNKDDPKIAENLAAMAEHYINHRKADRLFYIVTYLGAEITEEMQPDLNTALINSIKKGQYEDAKFWVKSGIEVSPAAIAALKAAEDKTSDKYIKQDQRVLRELIAANGDPKTTYENYISEGDYQSASACQPRFDRQDLSEQAREMLDTQLNTALQQGQTEAVKAWHQLGAKLPQADIAWAKPPQADTIGEFVAAENWTAIKTAKECGLEIPYQIQKKLSVELVSAIDRNDFATAQLLFDVGARIPKEKITSLQPLLVDAALKGDYGTALQLKKLGVVIDEVTQSILDDALRSMQSIPEVETIVKQLQELGAKATPPSEQAQQAEAVEANAQQVKDNWLQKLEGSKKQLSKPQVEPHQKTVEKTAEKKEDVAADVIKQEKMIEELTTAVRRRKKEDVQALKDQGLQISEETLTKLMSIVRQWTASPDQCDWLAELEWKNLLKPLLKS